MLSRTVVDKLRRRGMHSTLSGSHAMPACNFDVSQLIQWNRNCNRVQGSRERDQMSFRERPLKGHPSLRDRYDSSIQIRQPTNVLMSSGGRPPDRTSGARKVFSRNSSSPFVSDKGESSSSVKQSDHCSLLREVLPKLRPFQREAYDFATGVNSSGKSNNKPRNLGKILLADEMGLGKTVTSLAIMAKYRDEWPLLILCPASLRHIWPNEIEMVS